MHLKDTRLRKILLQNERKGINTYTYIYTEILLLCPDFLGYIFLLFSKKKSFVKSIFCSMDFSLLWILEPLIEVQFLQLQNPNTKLQVQSGSEFQCLD